MRVNGVGSVIEDPPLLLVWASSKGFALPDRAGLLRLLGKEEEMEEQGQMTLATTSEAPHGFNAN